jgi:hypothetical protein
MRLSSFSCVTVVMFDLCALLAVPACAQSNAENLLRAQQTWHTDCIAKGCILSVDILRGAIDSSPDPKNANQYISVAVGVDSTIHKPTMLTFEVDPNADRPAGVDLLFAHTVPDGKGWQTISDPHGPIHFPFIRCDETVCTAGIGGGQPDEATIKSCFDLVAKMQSEDHLFLSYVRGGQTYRTAVSLALFREAYQRLLAQAPVPLKNPTER